VSSRTNRCRRVLVKRKSRAIGEKRIDPYVAFTPGNRDRQDEVKEEKGPAAYEI